MMRMEAITAKNRDMFFICYTFPIDCEGQLRLGLGKLLVYPDASGRARCELVYHERKRTISRGLNDCRAYSTAVAAAVCDYM